MRMKTELLLGLASGAVIGSVVGLVLAPKSGKATRETLGHQIGKIKDRVAKKSDNRETDIIGVGQSKADYLH
jgi:gas vesicle protein